MAQAKVDHCKFKQLLIDVYQPEMERLAKESSTKQVIMLAGPTAVGKTALSLALAEKLNGEIVNADSMQIYQGMDVGTAKVSKEVRDSIPHHLIDLCELHESFTVVDFYRAATDACKDIIARNKVPIITGGTGFYMHALIYGPPAGPPSQPELRRSLEQEMEKFSPDAMYDRLQKIDPEYAATITHHDRIKIVRALEIIAITKGKVSALPKQHTTSTSPFNFSCWFLFRNRINLYQLINERCDEMLELGLLQEVQSLKEKGLENYLPISNAIGYRQCLEYLRSPMTKEDHEYFLQQFKRASRRYAKRQFTWFRKESDFTWLDLEAHDVPTASEIIAQEYLG